MGRDSAARVIVLPAQPDLQRVSCYAATAV
jgi:hypothetical protein